MNDRFKFRVWNQKHNFYCNQLAEMCINYNGYCFDNGVSADYFEHDGFVIEQCTGLKDKNGNLIYEGDIVKDEFGRRFTIVWSEEDCMFEGRVIYRDPEYSDRFDLYQGATDNIEIIGNIHEQAEQKRINNNR